MRRFRSAICAATGGLPLLLIPPALGQIQAPPLPPLAPPLLGAPASGSPTEPSAAELSSCVSRYGHTGCAARLYARLLCEIVGQSPMPEGLQQQLDAQYEQAAIDFRGITVTQVESAAVRYYVPMLCPTRSRQIQQLFAPLAQPDG